MFRTFYLRFAALLFVVAFTVFTSASQAQTCANVLATSPTVEALTLLPEKGEPILSESGIDPWDTDVIKLRLTIAGLLVVSGAGIDIGATLYEPHTTNGATAISSQVVFDANGDKMAEWVQPGTYCLQVEDAGGTGTYEVEVKFLDGCDLQSLPGSSGYCTQ